MPKQIRVLQVLTSGDPTARGIAQTVLNLAGTLDRERYSMSVLFLRNGGEVADTLSHHGIDCTVAGWNGNLSDVSGATRFMRKVAVGGYHIVHFHAGGVGPRILSKSVSRARVVAHYHSLKEESGVREPKERSGSFADLLVANSSATARTLGDKSVVVIHPGIPSRRNCRHNNGAGGVHIGVASRLVSIKGIVDLIAAVALLASRGLDAQLDIAGTGPEENALLEASATHGVSERVHFLGWIDDVQESMCHWDVYAQPSRAEGFGLSVLEAMAAGLPVVATSVGGLPEIVLEGETGFLVPPATPAALAERIERLARAPELRARMGDRGRARALGQFSAERESFEIQSAYESLLA